MSTPTPLTMGIVGLGRMGAGIAERLRRDGHTVIGFDANPAVSDTASLPELVERLPAPRILWVMVPAGEPAAPLDLVKHTPDDVAQRLLHDLVVGDQGLRCFLTHRRSW